MSHGFTLIELLVVVLIIGILAAIALPQYQKVKDKVCMQSVKQGYRELYRQVQLYYLVHGADASTAADLVKEAEGSLPKLSASGNEISWMSACGKITTAYHLTDNGMFRYLWGHGSKVQISNLQTDNVRIVYEPKNRLTCFTPGDFTNKDTYFCNLFQSLP